MFGPKHELMSMPVFAGVGVLGGLLRDLSPNSEEVWRFSPLLDFSFYRLLKGKLDLRRSGFQLAILLSIVFSELLRLWVARLFPRDMIFSLADQWHPGTFALFCIYVSAVFTVMLPLKIWNASRNEKKLEAQQLRLNEARLAA